VPLKKLLWNVFSKKLIKTKIEQSQRLIATTDLSLEEISKRVGYGSYNAFFDAFHSLTGKTPSSYRQAFHQKDSHKGLNNK